VGSAQSGTGGTLTFATGNLTANTTFSIRASKTGCSDVTLTQTQTVTVTSAPSAGLTVSADANSLCSGSNTNINVASSESGVSYTLLAGGSPVGSAQSGTGGTLTFATGNLTANTTFSIRASKTGCSDVTLTQTQTVTVSAAPSAGLTVSADANSLCSGSNTNINVASSESGVSYTLLAGGSPVGSAQSGTGGTLTFATGNLTANTTFSIRASKTGCSDVTLTQTQTVTVSAAPSAGLTVSADASSLCSGGSTNINVASSESGVSYTLLAGGSPVGSAQSGTGGTLTFATGNLTANTTFSIRASKTGCSDVTLTQTQTVTVSAAPSAGLTVSAVVATICGGVDGTVRIASSESGVSYQAYIGASAVGSAATGNGGNLDLTIPGANLSAGANTITIKATKTGCSEVTLSNTASINVTSGANVSLTVSALAATICSDADGTVRIAASETDGSYQAYIGASAVGSAANGNGGNLDLTIPKANLSAGANTITVKVTKTGCGEATLTNTASITVNTAPSNSLGVSAVTATICSGTDGTVRIASSESGVSYQAYIGASAVGSAATGNGGNLDLTIPAASLSAGANTISIKANITACSEVTLTNTASITVNTAPSTSLSVSAVAATICSGTDGTVRIASSESGVSYQAYIGATAVGSAANGNGGNLDLTIPTASLSTGNNTITVKATKTGCSEVSLTNTASITVNALPNNGLGVSAVAASICAGIDGTVRIASSESGVSYQAYIGAGAVGSAATGNGGNLDLTIPAASLSAGANTISIKANIAGCSEITLTNTTSINVGAGIDIGLAVSPVTATTCSGTDGTVRIASSESGISYQAYIGGNAVGTASNGNGGNLDLTIPAASLSTGNNTITIKATKTGCGTATLTNTADIIVNASPLANITNVTGSSVAFCGTTGSLTATEIVGATYQWKKDGTNVGTNSNQLAVTAAGSYMVDISVNGCSSTSSAVTVSFSTPLTPSVSISSDANNNAACAGNAVVFTATSSVVSTPRASYQWKVNGQAVADNDGVDSTFTTSTLNNSDIVSVSLTFDPSVCLTTQSANSNEISMTIEAVPVISFSSAAINGNSNLITLKEGESVTVEVSGAETYTWSPTDGVSATGSQAILNPTQNTTYTVTGSSSIGCTGSDTLRVIVIPNTDIFIPSLFSPNGDGQNDRFVLRGTGFKELTFRVYDRSGHLIYETSSIDEATNTGWDGTKNGVKQPIGMYTWSITGTFVDGREISFKGAKAGKINLLR
jgi:gliding motility-associated-like protein